MGLRANGLTLGESEDPVSTMSTDLPGGSSTWEGLRLNTGLSSPEEGKDSPIKPSFWLGARREGRTVRPPFGVFPENRKPSVLQYNRCVRLPWFVSLKGYWHDAWLMGHTEDSKEVRHPVSTTFSGVNSPYCYC